MGVALWLYLKKILINMYADGFTTQPPTKQMNTHADLDGAMEQTLAEAGLDGVTVMMRFTS